MNPNPPPRPPANVGKRRQIDRATLHQALAEQQRRDAETPPANLLTTMGAIRLLGDLILDRHARGWTDPMLVTQLREMGVEISADTLRVYRGRLKEERAAQSDTLPTPAPAPRPTIAPSVPPRSPASPQSHAASAKPVGAADADSGPATPPSESSAASPTDCASFSRTVNFDDQV